MVICHHPPHPSPGNRYVLFLMCVLYIYIIQYNGSNYVWGLRKGKIVATVKVCVVVACFHMCCGFEEMNRISMKLFH